MAKFPHFPGFYGMKIMDIYFFFKHGKIPLLPRFLQYENDGYLLLFLRIWKVEKISYYPGFYSSLCDQKWANGEGLKIGKIYSTSKIIENFPFQICFHFDLE